MDLSRNARSLIASPAGLSTWGCVGLHESPALSGIAGPCGWRHGSVGLCWALWLASWPYRALQGLRLGVGPIGLCRGCGWVLALSGFAGLVAGCRGPVGLCCGFGLAVAVLSGLAAGCRGPLGIAAFWFCCCGPVGLRWVLWSFWSFCPWFCGFFLCWGLAWDVGLLFGSVGLGVGVHEGKGKGGGRMVEMGLKGRVGVAG